MGRVFQSGAEMDPSAFALTDFGGVLNATSTTTTVRSGLRALRWNNSAGWAYSPPLGALTKAYARAYIYIETAPTTTTAILGFNSTAGGHWGYIAIRPDQQAEVRINTGLTQVLGGPSGWTFSLNTWHLLEFYLDVAGVIQAKLGGNLWYWSGATFTTTGLIDVVVVGPSTNAMTVCVDDIAANSTVGSVNSSWCGPGSTYMLVPGKDFFNYGWSTQPAGSVIDQINDLPGPIDTTTYIFENTGTYGQVVGWHMTEMPVSGAVSAMQWGVRGSSITNAVNYGRLDIRDSLNRYGGPTSGNLDFGTTAWRTFYPAVTVESVWDGTGRMLSSSTPFVTGHQAQALRLTGGGARLIWTAMWCNVEVAMPLTITGHPTRWGQRSLTELETG